MPPLKITGKFPGWLVLMAGLAALGPLAIDLYLPAFPAIGASLNVTPGQVERTLVSYLIGLAIAQIIYGPLADRYGRKLSIMGGLVIFIIASLGCIFTTDVNHLNFWRIIQALGGAAGMVIPRAVIRDRLATRDAAKALSLLMLITGLMPILGPILGGQMLMISGWRSIFVIMALFGTFLLIMTWYTMEETLPAERVIALRPSLIAHNYWALLQHRQFMFHTLASGFGMAGLFTYISGSPRVFMSIYHIDPQHFGFYFGLNAGALIVASQFSARLLDRFSPQQLLRAAQTIVIFTSLAGLGLTLAGWLILPLLMFCLMAFMGSLGFVNPNAAALALARQGKRLGVASALMGTVQMLCGAIAGALVSLWQSDTPLPLTGMLCVCAILSWLFGRLADRQAG